MSGENGVCQEEWGVSGGMGCLERQGDCQECWGGVSVLAIPALCRILFHTPGVHTPEVLVCLGLGAVHCPSQDYPLCQQDPQVSRTLTLISKTIQTLGSLSKGKAVSHHCGASGDPAPVYTEKARDYARNAAPSTLRESWGESVQEIQFLSTQKAGLCAQTQDRLWLS